MCGRNGITLNPDKFDFAQDHVEFAGFEITEDSVRPCSKCINFIKSIADFPTPKTITDIRSWLGLVNQVSYAFGMADKMLRFRELLKPNKKFMWDDELDLLFNKSKDVIIREIDEGVRILTRANQHALQPTGQRQVLDFGSSRNTVLVLDKNPFAA
jgi:hypothetical protein